VVIARSGSKRWIAAADQAAAKLGLRVGMPAAKAQALVQGLTMIDADPVADLATLERLTLWALSQYSPVVAMDPPDGIVMDTEGADLIVHRVDNTIQSLRAGTAKPVRDIAWLTKLFRDRIEKIEPGFGIEKLSLAAIIAEPLVEAQSASSLIEEQVTDVTPLIDVLGNRGGQRIFRVAPVASDVPERSVRRIAPTADEVGATWPLHWPRVCSASSSGACSSRDCSSSTMPGGSPSSVRLRISLTAGHSDGTYRRCERSVGSFMPSRPSRDLRRFLPISRAIPTGWPSRTVV